MALRDFLRRSKNSVNHVLRFGFVNPFNRAVAGRKFSDMYFLVIVNRIFQGLRNVNFDVAKEHDRNGTRQKLMPLLRFLNDNLSSLVWQLWNDGFIVLDVVDKKIVQVPSDKVRKDGYGAVINYNLVVYSESYRLLGKSDMAVVRESLFALDNYKNADIYLTQTFGAFGILSGKSMGINAADKEELQQQMKLNAGTTKDRDQFFITNSEVDFKQIDFKIKELGLPEKVKDEVMALAGYFCVPYDLIPMSGQSTYANQEQAIVDFYRNCIAPLAEVVLSLGRYVILKCYRTIPTTALTFHIDNVAELADDRTALLEYKVKLADLALKMRDLGLETPEYIEKELETEK